MARRRVDVNNCWLRLRDRRVHLSSDQHAMHQEKKRTDQHCGPVQHPLSADSPDLPRSETTNSHRFPLVGGNHSILTRRGSFKQTKLGCRRCIPPLLLSHRSKSASKRTATERARYVTTAAGETRCKQGNPEIHVAAIAYSRFVLRKTDHCACKKSAQHAIGHSRYCPRAILEVFVLRAGFPPPSRHPWKSGEQMTAVFLRRDT